MASRGWPGGISPPPPHPLHRATSPTISHATSVGGLLPVSSPAWYNLLLRCTCHGSGGPVVFLDQLLNPVLVDLFWSVSGGRWRIFFLTLLTGVFLVSIYPSPQSSARTLLLLDIWSGHHNYGCVLQWLCAMLYAQKKMDICRHGHVYGFGRRAFSVPYLL